MWVNDAPPRLGSKVSCQRFFHVPLEHFEHTHFFRDSTARMPDKVRVTLYYDV